METILGSTCTYPAPIPQLAPLFRTNLPTEQMLSNQLTELSGDPARDGQDIEGQKRKRSVINTIKETASRLRSNPGNNSNDESGNPSSTSGRGVLLCGERLGNGQETDQMEDTTSLGGPEARHPVASLCNGVFKLLTPKAIPSIRKATAQEPQLTSNNAISEPRGSQDVPKSSWKQIVPLSSGENTDLFISNGVYCGLQSKFPPPDEALQEWTNKIQCQLWVDLEHARTKTRRKGEDAALELELRMSGKSKRGAAEVELAPAIWILCGSTYCKKRVEMAVRDMEWLRPFRSSFVIETHVGSPMFSVDTERTDFILGLPHGDPIPMPDGTEILFHVEEAVQDVESACGRLCCATVLMGRKVIQQSFSRLGGMVDIANHFIMSPMSSSDVFGMTTAHGFYQYLVSQADDFPNDEIESDSDDDRKSMDQEDLDDSDKESYGSNSSPKLQAEQMAGIRRSFRLGYKDPRLIPAWTLVPSTGPVNILGRGAKSMRPQQKWWSDDQSLGSRAVKDADFALLKLNVLLHNRYLPGGKDVQPVVVDQVDMNLCLSSGEAVRILVDAAEPIEGFLLPGAAGFRVQDATFQTKKIELSGPLGTSFADVGPWQRLTASSPSNIWLVGGSRKQPLWHDRCSIRERTIYAYDHGREALRRHCSVLSRRSFGGCLFFA